MPGPDHGRGAPRRHHLERGRAGEEMAADWYRRHGYAVVARNWRCPLGEIDLIVSRRRLLVVCEVKSRRTDTYGPAASAVDARKQQRLRQLAAAWLAATGGGWRDVRFDVVAITGDRLEVIEAAF